MSPVSFSKRYNRAPAQTLEALHVPEALLRLATVLAVTGLSESTIRRKAAEGEFPRPIKYGARCTRWVAGDVANWLRIKGATKIAAPLAADETPCQVSGAVPRDCTPAQASAH